eukprot:CAMPEP_0114628378 /NCGR_PEP_ID=MMETSP0168-20121206/12790_1 /TAXON_ID=95228 ORGANISM="Vannella sp., Strain DIVA3 517/6/12" /NCGR_SAMPLE_ID=MMETSP0168 /ASSEMBLY_ACC=CAM_ASM_000044 /LENGTH=462 /DNA_ID=CAMNT_0001839759 /DNA_START=174 /DNA_END=1562 /DNA_ORIENTATION=-
MERYLVGEANLETEASEDFFLARFRSKEEEEESERLLVERMRSASCGEWEETVTTARLQDASLSVSVSIGELLNAPRPTVGGVRGGRMGQSTGGDGRGGEQSGGGGGGSQSGGKGESSQESHQQHSTSAQSSQGQQEEVKTDKYGFVVAGTAATADAGTPSTPKATLKQQAQMENKWLQILSEWKDYSDDKKRKLAKRFRKGIPDRLRGEMWKKLLNTDALVAQNPKRFSELLTQSSPDEAQIQRDIHRTFPEHVFFQERGGLGQTALYDALKAYSIHNPQVGYCQGMGFIIATFLLYMTAEEAFYLLACIIDKFDMSGLFMPGFPSLMKCFYIHEQLLLGCMPRLYAHLEAQMVSASMYATKWYTCLYTISLPFNFVVRVWDVLLVNGFDVIYRVALAILKFLQKDLLKLDFEGIMERLRNLDKYLTDMPDEFISQVMEFKLSSKRIQKISKDFDDGGRMQ